MKQCQYHYHTTYHYAMMQKWPYVSEFSWIFRGARQFYLGGANFLGRARSWKMPCTKCIFMTLFSPFDLVFHIASFLRKNITSPTFQNSKRNAHEIQSWLSDNWLNFGVKNWLGKFFVHTICRSCQISKIQRVPPPMS